MLSSSEYKMIMIVSILLSLAVMGAIVALVIFLVRRIRGSKMEKGYDEEEHLVRVPGYDDN